MTARPICNSGRFATESEPSQGLRRGARRERVCGVVDGARDNLLVKVCLSVNI